MMQWLHALWLCLAFLCVRDVAWAAPPTGEVLRIAVHLDAFRDTSRADVEASMKVWAGEMMVALDVPAEVSLYQSIAEIRRDLKAGRINFVIADPLDLLRQFDPDDLSDGFGSTRDAEGMVLLVRRDGGIRGIRDLAGRQITVQSGNEISQLIMETTCLHNFRKNCAAAEVTISKENRAHQQILKLFFGKTDAALVRNQSYLTAIDLNPQVADKLSILKRIPVYPSALGLFSNQVSPAFREYVIAKASLLETYTRGRQILEVMQMTNLSRYPKIILDPIRELLREYETLTAHYALRKVSQ